MGKLERGYVVEGRYRLDALLGEGGYGAVWKAIQLNVNRPVAIKFLKAMASDPSGIRRFEREAKALGRLQHPHCVTMLDYGQSDIGLFLVTEYLDGERLDHWAEGDHELPVIFMVALQILAALDHAHQQRIVHRDLKPANILVTRNAGDELVIKVLDFGIASVVGAKRGDITKTGEVFGTPGYMAPEQLLGESNVGPPADLYSFGVVLHQMIEKQKLFTANSGIEVAMKHLTQDPPPMQRPLPNGLQDIVGRLLAKQAGERFQSAEDVARAMQRVMKGEVVAPLPRETAPPGFDRSSGEIPRPGAATPPTRPGGPDGAPANPMAHRTVGHQSGSSSGVRLRPNDPSASTSVPVEPNSNLGWIALMLVVLVVALGVIAYSVWPRDEETVAVATNARDGASNLLRREHLATDRIEVKPLRPKVKITPHKPDMGHDPKQLPARSAGCGGQQFRAGFQELSVMVGPLDARNIHIYIPEGYDPQTAYRTMIALHDTSQLAYGLFNELNLGPTADRDNVVIVFPEVDTVFNPWKYREHWTLAKDDWRAARSVVCLDDSGIMLLGFGSGGHAAQKLACELPNVGALAQSTYRNLESDTYCEHPQLPYLYLAPMKDGRDPPEGGTGCMIGDDVVSVQKQEEIYKEMYECKGPDRIESRHGTSVCKTWDCASPYIACRLDGGRPLPRQMDTRLADCEGSAADFPYRDKMWDFLVNATASDEVADD